MNGPPPVGSSPKENASLRKPSASGEGEGAPGVREPGFRLPRNDAWADLKREALLEASCGVGERCIAYSGCFFKGNSKGSKK